MPVPDAIECTPELRETERGGGFELVPLQDLVRMKLISFRDKDRMHLRDVSAEKHPQGGLIGRVCFLRIATATGS